jgi:hypothetical protein
MYNRWKKTDRKIAAKYMRSGIDFTSSAPKSYAESRAMNLTGKTIAGVVGEVLGKGTTRFLNWTSSRALKGSDMVVTRPFASAVFQNNVAKWLRTLDKSELNDLKKEYGVSGIFDLATNMVGYTESNIEESTKQAIEEINEYYGEDFLESKNPSVVSEGSAMLLFRTQELILENSGIEERMDEAWYDSWTGEGLLESSMGEAKTLALQGEVSGVVGVVTDLIQKLVNEVPFLKYKIPFTSILGNMLNMGMKGVPIVNIAQPLTRYLINESRVKNDQAPIKSSSVWLLQNFIGETLLGKEVNPRSEKYFQGEGVSKRRTVRDIRTGVAITAAQTVLLSLMATDEDDDGLIFTGPLDKSFYNRYGVTKGTGLKPYSVYRKNSDGSFTEVVEYKNSPLGFAIAPFAAFFENRDSGESLYMSLGKSLMEAPFYIADKPAAMAMKEMMEALSMEDKYGNNRFTDESGYKDKTSTAVANFVNSLFVPNFLKQGNKMVEQSFGLEAKRATTWQQNLLRGIPYFNQEVLETQYDHFGRPVTQFLELGFLGAEYDANGGFRWLGNSVEERVDKYYQLFTDHSKSGERPKYFTEKEVEVWEKNKSEKGTVYYSKKTQETVLGNKPVKIRLSKTQGHELNRLMATKVKELIDFDFEGIKKLNDSQFKSRMTKINKIAKKMAIREAWDSGLLKYTEPSNKPKERKYQGKKG